MASVHGTRLYRYGPKYSLQQIEAAHGYFEPLKRYLKPFEIWMANDSHSLFRWTGYKFEPVTEDPYPLPPPGGY